MKQLDVLKDSQHAMPAGEEWVSALLDGELEDAEAGRGLARLGKDDSAHAVWSEYALIGDIMRGCAADSARLDSRFRAALAAEPTVLAPLPANRDTRRPFYWMAAAAAVAGITWSVLSVAPPPDGPALPVAVTSPAEGAAGLASDSFADSATNSVANSVPNTAAGDAPTHHVMPYLAAHQDYAYAVVSEPEMRFTQVSLREAGR